MTDAEENRGAAPLTSPAGAQPPRRFFYLHVLTLLALLGLWTWKLLEPNPVPEVVEEQLTGDVRLVAAKSLHACGYGLLTVLAVTLPVPRYWRWYFVGLLALHGVATEIGQTFVPGRSGRVMDVVIDWAGIGSGVLFWRVVFWRGRALKPFVEPPQSETW